MGVFFPSLDSYMSNFRDLFSRLRDQKLDVSEPRVSVLAPKAAVLTMHGSFIATFKEGGTFETPFAWTLVCAKVEEHWKIVHAHQTFPMTASNGSQAEEGKEED